MERAVIDMTEPGTGSVILVVRARLEAVEREEGAS